MWRGVARRCGRGGGEKFVDSECGCGGGPVGPRPSKVPDMTASTSTKVKARRRAREATRRANEARAVRERANIENAATYIVAKTKLAAVDRWERERLAQLRDQVRAEANKRRAVLRAEAGAALKLMHRGKGESLTTIADLTGDGIGEIRAMLRHAPKPEKPTASGRSQTPSGDGAQAGVQEWR